mgnify:CR=1 FL=1
MTTHPFLTPSALGQYASAGAVRSARVAGVVQDGYRRWLAGLTNSAGETARLVSELGKCRTQADLVALQRELFDHASTRLADDLRAFIELSGKLVAEVTAPVGPVAAAPADSVAPAPVAAPAPTPVAPAPVVEAAPEPAPAPVEIVTEAPAPAVDEEPAPVAEAVEAAAEEAPAEAPAVETPVAETPVIEAEAVEAEADETPAAEDAVSPAEAVAAALDGAPAVPAPAAVSARPSRGKAPRGGRSNPRSKPAPAH